MNRNVTYVTACCTCAIVLLVFLNMQDAVGMAAEEHYREWYEVLGVTDANSQKALLPLFEFMQKDVIDAEGNSRTVSKLRSVLKDRWELTFSGHNHRVLFHWGFNQDILKYEPLLKEIDEQWKKKTLQMHEKYTATNTSLDYDSFLKESKREVLDLINKERKKRNREIIDLVASQTGLQGGLSGGLATILWDTHILVDYGTEATGGLLQLKSLRQDMVKHGLEQLFFQERTSIKTVADELYKYESNYNEMLAVLKKYFPGLLQKYWGNTLKKKGIIILTPSE